MLLRSALGGALIFSKVGLYSPDGYTGRVGRSLSMTLVVYQRWWNSSITGRSVVAVVCMQNANREEVGSIEAVIIKKLEFGRQFERLTCYVFLDIGS